MDSHHGTSITDVPLPPINPHHDHRDARQSRRGAVRLSPNANLNDLIFTNPNKQQDYQSLVELQHEGPMNETPQVERPISPPLQQEHAQFEQVEQASEHLEPKKVGRARTVAIGKRDTTSTFEDMSINEGPSTTNINITTNTTTTPTRAASPVLDPIVLSNTLTSAQESKFNTTPNTHHTGKPPNNVQSPLTSPPLSPNGRDDSTALLIDDKNAPSSSRRVERADTEYDNYLMRASKEDFYDIKPLKIIYQPGKDPYDRPIVVIVGANLPARTIDMERVTLYAISVMDPIVESDYVLVYVHTNITSDNKPNFAWLRKMYTIFNRKYKKNLKALYIIHPTVWVKMTFRLFKPFISNKFWRKLVYIEQSSDIFNYFPKDQISLPASVINYGMPPKKSQPIFAQKLEDVVRRQTDMEGHDIPVIVTNAIKYLSAKAMDIEGIFRLSGSSSQIKELKRSFDSGEEIDLEDVEDVHVVAGILKLYLRELPIPLFTFDLYPPIVGAITLKNKDEQTSHICAIISALPKPHRATVKALFVFLAKVVSNSQINKMNASNVSIVMGPNLIRDPNESMESAVTDAAAINAFVAALLQIASQHPELLAAC